jgi:hypothetical protein
MKFTQAQLEKGIMDPPNTGDAGIPANSIIRRSLVRRLDRRLSFTQQAEEFVQSVERIVLIDGERLTAFMIEHGVGVSHRVVKVPKVDGDYFSPQKLGLDLLHDGGLKIDCCFLLNQIQTQLEHTILVGKARPGKGLNRHGTGPARREVFARRDPGRTVGNKNEVPGIRGLFRARDLHTPHADHARIKGVPIHDVVKSPWKVYSERS